MIKDFKAPINISLYSNKEGFHSISVYQNEKWLGFKYPYSDFKDKIKEVETEAGTIKVYKEVNSMFKKEAEEIIIGGIKNLEGTLPECDSQGGDNADKKTKPGKKTAVEDVDDLPF